MRYTYTSLLLFFAGCCLSAQICFEGQVLDAISGEPLIGASILQLESNQGTVADLYGRFKLCATVEERENYTLEIKYTGYSGKRIILDRTSVDSFLTIELEAGVMLEDLLIVAYQEPLIKQDESTRGDIVTSSEIRQLPTRNVNALKGTGAGVASGDNGRGLNIRGSRSNASYYIIDGVRISGDPGRNEQYNEIKENAFTSSATESTSTFSADVDRASYANVRRFINQGQIPPADAVRVEEIVNYFHYSDTPPPTNTDHPLTARSELTSCPWDSSHQLLRIGLRAQGLQPGRKLASNYVFLVDVSGSMGSIDKLPLVVQSLKLLSQHLGSNDRVSIVTYAGATKVVLAGANGDSTQTIIDALDELHPGGGTAGAAGIELAYKLATENFIQSGNNRVILATDGDFNVGLSSQQELVKMIEQKRDMGIFLTILGYGQGNYQEGTMQELADRGNGNHAYIDSPREAKKVLIDELGGTLHTIAKDVKFQLEFDPKLVKGYRLVGYENRLLANQDFEDDTKDAGEVGAGHVVTVLYEIVPGAAPKRRQNLAELRIRYKMPDSNRSRLLTWDINAQAQSWGQTSHDTRWAAAVAEFGMLLRDSPHKGTADWSHCLQIARAAVGRDWQGYRTEMIGLIEKSMAIK
ncbi:MAG: von Willebrand factor type A domain-containing protein [Bacteroidota bacterium]